MDKGNRICSVSGIKFAHVNAGGRTSIYLRLKGNVLVSVKAFGAVDKQSQPVVTIYHGAQLLSEAGAFSLAREFVANAWHQDRRYDEVSTDVAVLHPTNTN